MANAADEMRKEICTVGVILPESKVTRRAFIGAGVAGLVLAHPLSAMASIRKTSERKLSLVHLHTGENLSCSYWNNGSYLRDSLSDINQLLRDHRSGEQTAIDPKVLDILWSLWTRSGARRPIEVFSAYRSPSTNDMLRRRSRGVARQSYHMQGKAVDIKIPGVTSRQLVHLAKDLGKGGVGYYPRSGFVHIDTGPVRYWRG
jgi:uncharacterized protein YcbK (DUF882 family)